mmetsp:Transcript_29792/g.78162  ORF Transcript_29792/g.78162 Transcript_29792/m.78162 type:complete len:214 (-) Transcript_29792:174-815(-)
MVAHPVRRQYPPMDSRITWFGAYVRVTQSDCSRGRVPTLRYPIARHPRRLSSLRHVPKMRVSVNVPVCPQVWSITRCRPVDGIVRVGRYRAKGRLMQYSTESPHETEFGPVTPGGGGGGTMGDAVGGGVTRLQRIVSSAQPVRIHCAPIRSLTLEPASYEVRVSQCDCRDGWVPRLPKPMARHARWLLLLLHGEKMRVSLKLPVCPHVCSSTV